MSATEIIVATLTNVQRAAFNATVDQLLANQSTDSTINQVTARQAAIIQVATAIQAVVGQTVIQDEPTTKALHHNSPVHRYTTHAISGQQFEHRPPTLARRIVALTRQGITVNFDIRLDTLHGSMKTTFSDPIWTLFGADDFKPCTDPKDYVRWLTDILDTIWELKVCIGCQLSMTENAKHDRDPRYCYNCNMSPKMAGKQCVICHDDFHVVGKSCTCSQVICAECWPNVRQKLTCPYCRVPYPTLERRYEPIDPDETESDVE